MDETLAHAFDLGRLPAEFFEDPYPTYRALQRVAPCKLMDNGQYFLTRYEDLAAIYRNVDLYSSDKTAEFCRNTATARSMSIIRHRWSSTIPHFIHG